MSTSTTTTARRRSRSLVAASLLTAAMTTLPAHALAQAPAACPHADDTRQTAKLPQLRGSIACLLRQERRDLGAGPVRRNPALARAATHQATTMVDDGFFGHVNPNGEKLTDRLSRAKWIPRTGAWDAGEILAWGTGTGATPRAFVAGWIKSAEHFEILKDPAFTQLGVGLAAGTPSAGGQGLTAAVEFGRR